MATARLLALEVIELVHHQATRYQEVQEEEEEEATSSRAEEATESRCMKRLGCIKEGLPSKVLLLRLMLASWDLALDHSDPRVISQEAHLQAVTAMVALQVVTAMVAVTAMGALRAVTAMVAPQAVTAMVTKAPPKAAFMQLAKIFIWVEAVGFKSGHLVVELLTTTGTALAGA